MHSASASELATGIGRQIRDARLRLGLRQSDLAVVAGLSVRTIHHIERGSPSVKLETLMQVLDALQLTLEPAPKRAHPSNMSREA